MPTLDDIPSLASLTAGPAGNDIIPICDVSDLGINTGGRSPVKGITLNSLVLGTGDVETVTGTTATIGKKLTVFTSTSAITATLPAASGNLRDIYVLKASATSAVAVGRAGTDVIVSGTSVSATSVSIAAGLTGHFISDGTTWYHVSNDA